MTAHEKQLMECARKLESEISDYGRPCSEFISHVFRVNVDRLTEYEQQLASGEFSSGTIEKTFMESIKRLGLWQC